MDTSYLAQQVTTIIGQLHGLFDDIGVPSHERDSREAELFSALSETLHNQLKIVTNEKHELTEEAHRLVSTIQQMEDSLEDVKPNHAYPVDTASTQVTYPLMRCIQGLKEKYNVVHKLHKERLEQVKKLVEALESYSAHLEPSFIKIKLPPTSPNAVVPPTFDLSPAYVQSVDVEFTRVYEEYTRRVDVVRSTCDEMIKLWAELGTPQAQTDTTIVKYARDAPEQLGLHKDDLERLKAKKDKLVDEKRARERRLKDLKTQIEVLWEKLQYDESKRKQFLSSNRGCGLRTINEFESELAQLIELKRQNLHLFVEDARYKLQELWDGLYFSEEEMMDFTPAFSDVYSDALLSAHENEIARLEALREQRAPTLELIDRHRTLVQERDDLQASSQDASRLMAKGSKGEKRDPGKLLREEKMRKRISRELPKLEAELKKVLERWEDEYGRPFLVHGERYLDSIAAKSTSSKPAPARAKTPSAPPPQAKSAKSAPPSRAGTMRGPPPTRSKTPVNISMLGASVTRNNFSSSVSAAAQARSTNKSPSRLPTSTTRQPLKGMPYGGNSPERPQPSRADSQTIRKMAPPRAPPPKMKDLFVPPPAPSPTPHDFEDPRSGSIVRHIAPEDPYGGSNAYHHHQPSMIRHDSHDNPRHQYQPHHQDDQYSNYSSHAPSYTYSQSTVSSTRQISSSSNNTAATTASGSENWETYDDNSEPEVDASDAYYAKMRQAASRGKRFTPDGGYPAPAGGQAKRVKGIRSVEDRGETYAEHGGQMVRVEGSEAGWEDEEAY
ncbi:hypothetical protein EJ05DRAFT_471806 [Pseudovirgaria hyperparasitica]|uniref:Microtubule associated protein n=1 Tax=Pseudovirgaria hyperparasitica TaxID=470096 RepID=A0A6A6WKZ0_9PEZI|nr:uncharacterized protein EJ05DRAFT_471806 [Pseudovirgaria hyperparasitica]KAF2762847.1 hypothetical protein EJ05DRAFT_471806 [Pseudovirgaria hyperparasitica]